MQAATVSVFATTAKRRLLSRGGEPQLPTERQTSSSGPRVESRMRRTASAAPGSSTQAAPTTTRAVTSPVASAADQRSKATPLVSLQPVATSGISRPPMTNEGSPISRRLKMVTSPSAS